MQNPHVKYLKTKKGIFYLFYYEQGNIFCRHYAENGWTLPQKIAEEAAPIFSLCQYEDMSYLLYSNHIGQLYMASSQDLSNWKHLPMMDEARNKTDTRFFLLPTENTFHIIYHLPTETTGVDALYYTVFQDGQWKKPYQIDRFIPMLKTPFLARRLSQEHIILYYRTGQNVLSAREILLEPYTMGRMTPLIRTSAPFTDFSIVNDNEKIHLLYIVRGIFRTQVVYQYKHTSAISTPRILWESNNCSNCMAYLQDGKVILMWTVNGQPLRCISENGGMSFGPTERFTAPFPMTCTKGELLGAQDNTLNATECYGDVRNGFLPVVFTPFSRPVTMNAAERPENRPIYKNAYTAPQTSHIQQMEDLSALLAQRSDEIAAVNAHWKAQTEKLETELTALRQENAQLKTKFAETEEDA